MSSSEKNTLRIDCLAKRQRVSAEAAAACAQRFVSVLTELVPAGSTVAGYWPIRGEADVMPALSALYSKGHSVCLPVIEATDKPLFFRRWRPGDVVEMGRYGIAVPLAGAPVLKPDVLLVPVVAFDRSGNRLGYGAGYYDRTLSALRSERPVSAFGVAYALQEVSAIPRHDWDQRLDAVVSENEVIRASA